MAEASRMLAINVGSSSNKFGGYEMATVEVCYESHINRPGSVAEALGSIQAVLKRAGAGHIEAFIGLPLGGCLVLHRLLRELPKLHAIAIVNRMVARVARTSPAVEWGIQEGMHVTGSRTVFEFLRSVERFQTSDVGNHGLALRTIAARLDAEVAESVSE